MKKKIFLISVCIISLVLVSSLLFGINRIPNNDSFFWCDAYIAAPQESDYTISLTYFYKYRPFDFSDVSAIELVDAANVTVSSFRFYDVEKHLKYSSKGLEMKMHFGDSSISNCSTIRLDLSDGSYKTYSIGNWVFDIGEKESDGQLIDIWESPVASADGSSFPYSYTVTQQLSAVKIQYGIHETETVNMNKKNCISGKIALGSRAPMTLIRPRILCSTTDGTETSYGNICYCGALDVDEKDINESYGYLLTSK